MRVDFREEEKVGESIPLNYVFWKNWKGFISMFGWREMDRDGVLIERERERRCSNWERDDDDDDKVIIGFGWIEAIG